ncbi:hypothetical protein [Bradyrhizobium sp. SZCCHNRI2049]|uniref:DUF7227 family protein n=1 Tax=Bradyrhizobium sp. SZCCHNRI2049 TaxID=3057287 RepID=UPI002915E770|nr:hypothetical protein [Bradyrhizobium sp. SZCCHNRI2049]
MSYAVQLTIKSRNAKVGPMPVSTTAANTCPTACPMFDGGCYAKAGPLGLMWAAMSSAAPGSYYALPRGAQGFAYDWQGFCDAIAALPAGTVWRHNQAGDLPGHGNAIDAAALASLVTANEGKRGFTYTHKPLAYADNAKAIAAANAAGFTVNLSGNNMAHADKLADADIGPVACVLPLALERGHTKDGTWTEGLDEYRERIRDLATPAGRKVAVCPATYRDEVSCSTCQLCQRVDRKVIVGFPAHGASKKKADAIAAS